MVFDVHIIGGGPAGSFAGIGAIKQSANVILSEEHSKIGYPVHCSGLVSFSGLEELKSIVDYKKIIKNSINKAKVFGIKKNLFLEFDFPKAFVIDRAKFDILAAQRFESEGGKIAFNSKISKLEQLKAKNIIGADGPISCVARMFSFPKIEEYAFCYEGTYAFKSEEKNAVEIYLNKEVFGNFFGWIIPINEDFAKIGFGVDSGHLYLRAKNFFLEKMLKTNSKSISYFAALIPLSLRKQTSKKIANYSVILAGDSAGQTKASTGGGIYFSASCGYIAGKNFDNIKNYETEWRKNYLFDLKLHSLIHGSFKHLSQNNVDKVLELLRFIKFDKFLIENGEMDRISKTFSLSGFANYLNILARGYYEEI